MSYSWITFGQAKSALAGRLGDPGKVFWKDDEIGRIINEATRTWNSIAQFYRDRCTFNTEDGIAFYDLTQSANPNLITGNGGSGSQSASLMLGYSVTDQYLINDIQYHLIEPKTANFAGGWTGTEMFTMDDIVRAIERRRNLFLLLAGLHLNHSQVNYNPPLGDGRIVLLDSVQLVRRVSWLNLNNEFTPLWRDDEESANFLIPNWAINGEVPIAYSMIQTPPINIQVIPISDDIGIVDLITVDSPPNLNEIAGTLLSIPDDFSWVVKFGALADLLGKDSQAYDPQRSAYCEQRFQEGVRFALSAGTINQVTLDGITIAPSDLADFDSLKPSWQNVSVATNQKIEDLAIVGRNLIAVSPVPNAESHSIQLDIVRNIPIPINDGDFIQVGKEHFDAILDYSTHLAMFKIGGAEFEGTATLANRAMSQAMSHNRQLRAEAKDYDIMQRYSNKEDEDRLRMIKEKEAA